jgi:hypothetical protein
VRDRRKKSNSQPVETCVKESNDDVISGLARSGHDLHSAIFCKTKNAYNNETVQDRRKMSLNHKEETRVAPSTGDVTFGLMRPLVVETDILSQSTIANTSITVHARQEMCSEYI